MDVGEEDAGGAAGSGGGGAEAGEGIPWGRRRGGVGADAVMGGDRDRRLHGKRGGIGGRYASERRHLMAREMGVLVDVWTAGREVDRRAYVRMHRYAAREVDRVAAFAFDLTVDRSRRMRAW